MKSTHPPIRARRVDRLPDGSGRPGAQAGSTSESSAGVAALPRDVRTLLLEDDPGNAFVFQAFLETLNWPRGYHVDTLAQANDLIDDIYAGAFDLIVLDIMLPDGESYDLARKIRDGCDVPMVAYTARATPHDVLHLAQSGFQALMAKPLDFASFRDSLVAVLDDDRGISK